VIDRCNLTILCEPGQQDLAALPAAEGVEVTASLPCDSPANVDRQHGGGVFDHSIAGLRRLKALGDGDPARDPNDGLVLNLVDNPQRPSLPPPQGPLEEDHKRDLLLHDPADPAIRTADHWCGCTAGQGSSCGGALREADEWLVIPLVGGG
jgi:hypothetical protein